ncbi:ABC transporter ATP-binding protein [Listeria monocytogenes]|uniref:ABC transporter ATP-binding protein n=1 Tax=Listeria monocytogenes TaxID=1639 RepID=A0AB74NA43_LISMN|nr:ABC transporter ATP-binding protein [Listeria monocytogenes]ALQ16840.1 molybdenum ABC transporter ATP-binding protein [Listeria monocytogenes]ALQ18397.1 molybdenum ABC transporter ATP-binding protein [Listeria monocytogenes]EAC2869881.1 ABC transporter ATP-binding protein [Listeria monocytogenes]EAC5438931.1 ABC transporter ATP-binding protein [Listeria monocytogenes]EAC6905315.1 ABC transporter ATP-binding protein [Listeria monocytogenes]
MFAFENVYLKRDNKTILSDINWVVNEKENWAILGLNGSGKTTLLQLLNGYLWPSSGRLQVLGHIFGQTSLPELRKSIGWVSNALDHQLKDYELSEQIVLSGKFASIGIYAKVTADEIALAKKWLIDCGGISLIGKPYKILSQGERQIVLIARALMASPKLLILDEPCNGLDLFAKERLLERIKKIAELPKSPTMLFVTHHTEEILPCFDNIILLRDGEITHHGKTENLLTEEVLQDFYQKPVELIRIKDGSIAVYPK